jgi:hypothetical protein
MAEPERDEEAKRQQDEAERPTCAFADTEAVCPICGATYAWEHAHQICQRCRIPQSCCN